ncbi:hypothetical protein [Haladaptatus sp. NG-SE-30]
MGVGNWVDLQLAGIGAVIFAVIWALTNYSVQIADPELTFFAGATAVVLGIATVADALHGGLSD